MTFDVLLNYVFIASKTFNFIISLHKAPCYKYFIAMLHYYRMEVFVCMCSKFFIICKAQGILVWRRKILFLFTLHGKYLVFLNKVFNWIGFWPYHSSGSQSPASLHCGPGSISDQIMWVLWWTERHWGRFSPSTSLSPANSHSTECSTFVNDLIISAM
jgi:hypothetical protein